MELQKLIDQYLTFIREKSYSERTILRYQYLLGVFYDYLINENNINNVTLISYLNGITPENILSSLDFYISKGAASEDTVSMYISVIREFFKHIKKELNIGNGNLIESFGLSKQDENSFSFKFMSYTQNLLNNGTIKPSMQGIPFTDEQVRIVIQYCNKHLDRMIKSDTDYNRYIKSLSIKLVAYLGVSIDILNAIKVQHLDLECGTIVVSGYRIHLPYWLRQQCELLIKHILKNNTPNSPLFALSDGKAFSQANILGSFIENRLRLESDVQNPSSLTSLSKYAIIQLIDAGLDRDTIIDLTGYKDDIFDSCKQIVDKVDIGIKSKQIDAALKQIPSYDFL